MWSANGPKKSISCNASALGARNEFNIICFEQQEQLRTDQANQETVMGCWSSTSLWFVAFIALLTIGPTGGRSVVCTEAVSAFSTFNLRLNTKYGGMLSSSVANEPNSIYPTSDKDMFLDFNSFKTVWEEWKASKCSKTYCSVTARITKTLSDCYNLPSWSDVMKFSKCTKAKEKNTKCTLSTHLIMGSVKFYYAQSVCSILGNQKFCWILLDAKPYEKRNCM